MLIYAAAASVDTSNWRLGSGWLLPYAIVMLEVMLTRASLTGTLVDSILTICRLMCLRGRREGGSDGEDQPCPSLTVPSGVDSLSAANAGQPASSDSRGLLARCPLEFGTLTGTAPFLPKLSGNARGSSTWFEFEEAAKIRIRLPQARPRFV